MLNFILIIGKTTRKIFYGEDIYAERRMTYLIK